MNLKSDIVFDRNTVELVTVAAEYCAYIEQADKKQRDEFTDTLLKILPLLYLKAAMLPPAEEPESNLALENFVTENDYEVIRMTVAEVMAEKDDYLEVFTHDMKYSDTPIRKTISEDLADIYQDIKNFVCLFQTGLHAPMHDAIIECKESFANYWGQTLVNTLRALHDVKYGQSDTDAEEDLPKECNDID